MSKFLLGLGLGITSIFLLPNSQWKVIQDFYSQINDVSREAFNFLHYYSPKELNKRKSQEIRDSNTMKEAKYFEIKDELSDRKKIFFFKDLSERMRTAELVANQRGLDKGERVEIISSTIRDHFPEMIPGYEEKLI